MINKLNINKLSKYLKMFAIDSRGFCYFCGMFFELNILD